MSEKKPEEGMSRRRFLGRSAAAAGTVATGGVSVPVSTSIGSAVGVGAAGLPGFKVLQGLVAAVKNMSDILGDVNNITVKDIQDSLRGKLVLPRFPESENDWLNEAQQNRIDFTPQQRLLSALNNLPSDRPLKELLSNAVLRESHGTTIEEFKTNPAVQRALKLKTIIDPLCDEHTKAKDLVAGLKGYFVKLAKHAIQKPEDFSIAPYSDTYSIWQDLKIENVLIREVSYSGERYEYRDVVGRNDIGDLIDILENYHKNDETLTPLLSQLKEVNQEWETKAKQEHVDKENARLERLREKKREEETARREQQEDAQRKRNERQEEEVKQRLQEKKENPSERASCNAVLTHVTDDQYSVAAGKDFTAVDWHQWALSINPEARPHHVSFDKIHNRVSIKNTPENAPILRVLFRESNGKGVFRAKIPNRRAGIDLNEEGAQISQPISQPYGEPTAHIKLNVESQTVSASEFLNGKTVLGIDFSRASKFGLKDQLTGLNNIEGMKEELQSESRAIGGYSNDDNDNVTVMRFDISSFKGFNDVYGHKSGDIVLEELAHRISKAAEYETVIGRTGGDELTVIYYGGRKSEDDLKADMLNKMNNSSAVMINNSKGMLEPIGITAETAETKVAQFPTQRHDVFPMPRAA